MGYKILYTSCVWLFIVSPRVVFKSC